MLAGAFLVCCKSPLRAASRVLAAHASSQLPNSNSKRQWPRNQNHQKRQNTMNKKLKIVVIGGSGLIGTKLVKILRQQGHEVVAASPSSGVNTLTGEGLAERLAGAAGRRRCGELPFVGRQGCAGVLRNVRPQHPRRRSGRRRRPSCCAVGRRHRSPARERLLPREDGPGKPDQGLQIPYTIVRATQFFEFVGSIAQAGTDGETVRLPPAMMQPIVSGRCRRGLGRRRRRRTAQWHGRHRGPRPIRRTNSFDDSWSQTATRGKSSPTPTPPISARGKRPKPHSWRQSDPGSHPFQGLARQPAEMKRSGARLASSASRSFGLRLHPNGQ